MRLSSSGHAYRGGAFQRRERAQTDALACSRGLVLRNVAVHMQRLRYNLVHVEVLVVGQATAEIHALCGRRQRAVLLIDLRVSARGIG